MNPPRNVESLLGKREVLAALGIGEKALRRLIATGRLPVVKLGRTSPLKFRELDLRRLVDAATVKRPQPGPAGEGLP